MFLMVTMSIGFTSCGPDPEPEQPSIIGTWVCTENDGDFHDTYTLVFQKDYTGYIRNDFGSRASVQMNFDWSLVLTNDGEYRLSVIYKSGDRDIDGPFSGGYAQYNRRVTIAGRTLSILLSDNTVMLFSRQ